MLWMGLFFASSSFLSGAGGNTYREREVSRRGGVCVKNRRAEIFQPAQPDHIVRSSAIRFREETCHHASSER